MSSPYSQSNKTIKTINEYEEIITTAGVFAFIYGIMF